MLCGGYKEELAEYLEDLGRKARDKGYKSSAEEFQKARVLIPEEGCVIPEREEEISFHYEQAYKHLKEREKRNGLGWGALAGLISSPFMIWGVSKLIKATATPSSFPVNCPVCGGAIECLAGLRSGNCPFCGIRLEWKGG